MTREEILKMEAGVKLDALVTKEVMGEETRHVWQHKPHYADLDGGWETNPYYWCNFCEEHKWQKTKPSPGVCPARILPYSTSILAAWRVVEKMEQEYDEVHIEWRKGFDYMVCFGHPGAMVNFPICEAICKAALLAKLEAEDG